MTLTARQADRAKPGERPYKLADAHGLYLYRSSRAGGKITSRPNGWRAFFQPDSNSIASGTKQMHVDHFNRGPATLDASTQLQLAQRLVHRLPRQRQHQPKLLL